MPIYHCTKRLTVPSLLILASMLIACSEPPPPLSETVRAIRTVTVSEPASGKMRRFSGIVEAATTSSISFEVPGNVQEVKVDVGDSVSRGQVLARLDESRFQLNLDAANATVGRAEAELADARREWNRLRLVVEQSPGLISEQALDQAKTNYETARKNLGYNSSRLNLAKRDLERTVLRAPFDAVIASRQVDAFQEVNRGQKLFDLHVEDAMEAAISIPESEIKRVYLGLPGEVRFPAFPGQIHQAIVTEVSRSAGAANAFPVRLTIVAENSRIRPGLTAEVTLILGGENEETAYLIPIGALVPRGSEAESYVYVFDDATSTVKMTAIEHGSIRDNNIVVNSGLTAGDIVATAGVSFLRDGQQVRLMGQ